MLEPRKKKKVMKGHEIFVVRFGKARNEAT